VRISVSNTVRRTLVHARPDLRRGHGLRVVASIAAAHGGRFLVQQPAGAWVAVLELPLAPTPVPAAQDEHGAGNVAA
jgi:hypothetical protein